jgi:TatD DNase family protein
MGEVGLDFSGEGLPTKSESEVRGELLRGAGRARRPPEVVTLQSRTAEERVLELSSEFGVGPIVFQGYSGPVSEFDEAAKCGHIFSVNPAMETSASGQNVVARIPRERVLTETDGPHVSVGNRPARPADVRLVVEYLSESWDVSVPKVASAIWANFRAAIAHLR